MILNWKKNTPEYKNAHTWSLSLKLSPPDYTWSIVWASTRLQNPAVLLTH